MRKIAKWLLAGMILSSVIGTGSLLRDMQTLHSGLIRLHVVANSDSQEDQAVKLQVRDAVLACIERDLDTMTDARQAKEYLQENLPRIQAAANETLKALGVDSQAVVTLCREGFTKRDYDTFSLPAGIYESLRVVIGGGEGKNWWCVAFPGLCLPAASDGFEAVAAGAGFSEGLTGALAGEEGYEVRFFLLDALGQAENFFRRE